MPYSDIGIYMLISTSFSILHFNGFRDMSSKLDASPYFWAMMIEKPKRKG
jgi:hypothetical protein